MFGSMFSFRYTELTMSFRTVRKGGEKQNRIETGIVRNSQINIQDTSRVYKLNDTNSVILLNFYRMY